MSTASPSILSNSLKNSELKTTHNTFRGCRVPFLEIAVYSYFEKGCRKNVHATIPKVNIGYDQYTVSDTVAVEPTFVALL